MSHDEVVAGIDVGGSRKGCHLVVLRGSTVLTTDRGSPEHVARCAIESGAVLIGVDSPCAWGKEGFGRTAERDLARERIFCFSTPSRTRASTSKFYGWMLQGECVYQSLIQTHPLLDNIGLKHKRACFETFPHAITCALLGTEVASAKQKRTQRREMLELAGIDTRELKSIDALDAALCALTARYLKQNRVKAYGDAETGLIIVPTDNRMEISSARAR